MCGTARRRAALCPEGERARALFPGESTRGGRGNFFFGVETAQRGKQALERVKTPQLQSHTHFPSSLFHFFCVFMHDYTSSSFFEASGLKEFAGKSSSPSASHLASDKKLSCDASRHGIGQFTVESLGGTTRWAGRKWVMTFLWSGSVGKLFGAQGQHLNAKCQTDWPIYWWGLKKYIYQNEKISNYNVIYFIIKKMCCQLIYYVTNYCT